MKSILLILLVFISSISVFCQESHTIQANQLLEQAQSNQAFIGAAAGFSIAGTITWEQGTGYADQENPKAFEPATLTRIASIAKPMTAIAIMQLFEQGKLDLDQAIQQYLPEFPEKKEGAITIRQLLLHSSGIDDYKSSKEIENKKNYASLNEAIDIFKDRDLLAAPGTAFHYTTYGYVVLGRIIEKVSGMTYEAYLQENIWNKAGMTHTGIEVFGTEYPNKATLYHRKDNGKMSTAKATNLSDRVPGGGIYSCVTDLLKFGDAVLNHTLIKASSLEIMITDPGLSKKGNAYGLGWYLYGQNPKYGNVFGHTGGQTGCSAFLMLLPEQQTTIVVLSNTSGAMQAVTNIAIGLFDIAAEAKE